MNKGFFGKILWVDLSNETFKEEILPKELYRQYIGGYGLASKLIYDRMEAKADPLGPDSIFGFFPGLLTGTAAPYSGRYMVAGKSPLTGTWGDANAGGTFGPEIKKCGYDAILFKGIASSPKYVAIIGDKKEILDASDIWGLDIIEAEEKLKEKFGRFIKTAGIGQAGEKLSLISGIANDKGRIAARSGFGAVMGSKKLKTLILKGNKKVQFHDKETFMSLVKIYNEVLNYKDPNIIIKSVLARVPRMAKMMRRFRIGMSGTPTMVKQLWHTYGTSTGNTICAETGDSPVKNWDGIGVNDFPYKKSKNISADVINKYKVRDYGCFSCPVQCGAILKVPELNLEETHLPEYETCSAFGSLLLNHDLMSIFQINELCNRAAIDTISTGGTVAFAIECFEKGILTLDDTDGLDLTWGNSEVIVELVKKIINREGIGNILADGSKRAAEIIGQGSERFAITSLGQELGMHNPRKFPSLGFSYAFDPTPGRHTTASVDMSDFIKLDKYIEGIKVPKGWKKNDKLKAQFQLMLTGFIQTMNSAGLCMFSAYFGPYPFVELFNALTGWDITVNECIETGTRIQTLRQAFTLREGVDIANNELSGRVVGNPPDKNGPTKGITVDYKKLYREFCKAIGWNPENGHPLEKTLEKLKLEFAIKDFYGEKLKKKEIATSLT